MRTVSAMGSSVMESSTSQLELRAASWRFDWVSRNHSLCFALLRGLLNFAVVTFSLAHVGHPLGGAFAEGLAAGAQSALLQLAPVNERYQAWLHGAASEPRRFGRWLSVGVLYLTIMKGTGLLAGLAAVGIGRMGIDFVGTIALSTAQYPWLTAIARARARSQGRSSRRQQLARLSADAQTLVISVICVGSSALSSAGVGFGRAALVLVGLIGAVYRWSDRTPGRAEPR